MQKPDIEEGIAMIRQELATMQDLFISGENYNIVDGALYVLMDTVGPTQPSVQEIARIETQAAKATGVPVKLHIHSQPATVITAAGHEPYWETSRAGLKRQLPTAQAAVQRILETSGF